MGKNNDRMIYRRNDETWVNQREGASKASGVHSTQKEAMNEAKKMLQNSGGGELTVKGVDGKISSKDTIPPGNDPNSTLVICIWRLHRVADQPPKFY